MSDDTRDRLIALEVTVSHMADQMVDLGAKVNRMHDLLEQAKGARWALIVVWIAFGAAIANVPRFIGWIWPAAPH